MGNSIFRIDELQDFLSARLLPAATDGAEVIAVIPIEFGPIPSSGSWGVRSVCVGTGECVHVDLSEYVFDRKPLKDWQEFSLEELVFSLLSTSAEGLKSEDLVSAMCHHGIPAASVLKVIREQTISKILRFDAEFRLKLVGDLSSSLLAWGFYMNGVNKDKTYLRGKGGVAIGRL